MGNREGRDLPPCWVEKKYHLHSILNDAGACSGRCGRRALQAEGMLHARVGVVELRVARVWHAGGKRQKVRLKALLVKESDTSRFMF